MDTKGYIKFLIWVEFGLRKGYLKVKGLEDIKEMPKFYRLASIVKDI